MDQLLHVRNILLRDALGLNAVGTLDAAQVGNAQLAKKCTTIIVTKRQNAETVNRTLDLPVTSGTPCQLGHSGRRFPTDAGGLFGNIFGVHVRPVDENFLPGSNGKKVT